MIWSVNLRQMMTRMIQAMAHIVKKMMNSLKKPIFIDVPKNKYLMEI